MIWLMLYLICCLSTSMVAAIMTTKENEPTSWVAAATALAFCLAPLVWAFGIASAFNELCDLCDVKRGIRVPKSHRLEYDDEWWPKYYREHRDIIRARVDYNFIRSFADLDHWAVF